MPGPLVGRSLLRLRYTKRPLSDSFGFACKRKLQLSRLSQELKGQSHASNEALDQAGADGTAYRNAQRTIFSGIQPTGVPHLGNYVGALREWVRIQNSAAANDSLYFCVVDLHSLTSRSQTPPSRRESKRLTLASLLAAGLSPERSTLFYQSDVPQHVELHWILSCDASMGALARMTQWKSKLSDETVGAFMTPSQNPKSEERLKLGLFSYPVLQAADILLYGSTHVPVGEDQVAHLEFARAAANGFNYEYGHGGANGHKGDGKRNGRLLIPPKVLVSPSRRVMSLLEPEKKMSKSHEIEKSRVLLSDPEEVIRKKFRSALTDSSDGVTYKPDTRPGVANLLEIISSLDRSGRAPEQVAKEFDNMNVAGSIMRVLKERAANVVIQELLPVRERLELLTRGSGGRVLDEIAKAGREKAARTAEETMKTVRKAVGI